MNQQPITDVVGIAILILAYFFSKEVAATVGPYMVILVASVVGASFAVARRDKTTRAGALFYFTRVCGLAILVTVMIATFLASYNESLTTRLLIAPVAFMIGFIGDDLPDLTKKLVSSMFEFASSFRGGK